VKKVISEKANEQITIRVTEELKSRLESEASSQNRPLANLVKAVLINYIETLDAPKKIAERK
jgi:predicted DNA-binding protein